MLWFPDRERKQIGAVVGNHNHRIEAWADEYRERGFGLRRESRGHSVRLYRTLALGTAEWARA